MTDTAKQRTVRLHTELFRMQKEAQHNGVSPDTLNGYRETRNAANESLSEAILTGEVDFERMSEHMSAIRREIFSDGREPDTNDEGSDN